MIVLSGLTSLFSNFSEVQVGQSAPIEEVIESLKRNNVALKGIIHTPAGDGGELRTLNMTLR